MEDSTADAEDQYHTLHTALFLPGLVPGLQSRGLGTRLVDAVARELHK